jgi:hypothetical protein
MKTPGMDRFDRFCYDIASFVVRGDAEKKSLLALVREILKPGLHRVP